jgi:hypothetical protein
MKLSHPLTNIEETFHLQSATTVKDQFTIQLHVIGSKPKNTVNS